MVRTMSNRARPRRRDFQKGNRDLEGVEPRTSRIEDFQEGSRETQRSRKKSNIMAVNGLRDHDRLDRKSNFVVWKARILSILDRYRIKDFALKTIAIPVDPAENEKYEEAMARAKCIILDGVKDHVVPHIVEKDTTNEMWDALKKLYHTQKREQIDVFLSGLKEICD